MGDLGFGAYSNPKTSIDWDIYSRRGDPTSLRVHAVTGPVASHVDDLSFILDSGASCHISPNESDFERKKKINPVPIGGIGTIKLSVAQGSSLYLDNVYFVPTATTRVISVADLTRDNNYTCQFKAGSCWIEDRNGNIIARGRVSARNLYILTLYTRNIQGPVPHQTGSAPRGALQSYPAAAAPTVPTCPNCGYHRNYCFCERWDMQQQRQQQPQRRQQTYPPSGVRPQSVTLPGNDTWGVAADESFRTGNPEANNQYLSPGHPLEHVSSQSLASADVPRYAAAQGTVAHPNGSVPPGISQSHPTTDAPMAFTCRYQNCHRPADRDQATQELTEYCSQDHMQYDVQQGVHLCPACNKCPRRMDGYYCGSSCERWDAQRQQQPQRHQQYSPSGVRPHSVAPPSGNVSRSTAATSGGLLPNNQHLSSPHWPVEGFVRCQKCNMTYSARGKSQPRYERGQGDPVGYMSLPPCPNCGYSQRT